MKSVLSRLKTEGLLLDENEQLRLIFGYFEVVSFSFSKKTLEKVGFLAGVDSIQLSNKFLRDRGVSFLIADMFVTKFLLATSHIICIGVNCLVTLLVDFEIFYNLSQTE